MPVGREQVSVRLTGGGPYGLRISTFDNHGPQRQLIVAKLHKKSKARAAGVRVGDVVLSINGDRCQRMSEEDVNHLIDYNYDQTIQLIRGSDYLIHHLNLTSSFRHSAHPPTSPSPAPSYSGSEPTAIEQSTATELFRHRVQRHDHDDHDNHDDHDHHDDHADHEDHDDHYDQVSLAWTSSSSVQGSGQFERRGQPPAIKVTSHYSQDSQPQQPTKRVRWSGCGLEDGTSDEQTGKDGSTDGKDGRRDGFGWKKWTPPSSAGHGSGVESDGEFSTQSSHRQHFTTSTVVESSQPPPSFHPTQALPNKPRPLPWQPPSLVSQTDQTESSGVESTTLRPNTTTQPLDNLVHEVVIWSSKPTEVEQRDGGAGQKPLPWQRPQQPENKTTYPALNEDGAPSQAIRQKPSRWQPTDPQAMGNLDRQDLDNASKSPAWQAQQPTVTMATERTPSWQPTPTKAVDVLTSERSQPSRQHRWQPGQPPAQLGNINQPAGEENHLEDPRRSLQDGSSSPIVTSLFLTRVVTDGSAIAAGSGSDAEFTHDSAITQPRKLYGDSSFYEDPEHKYPTIEEQIKMARKVALLLTSPANTNARGQRMFLKRKEQSSKWVIDPTLNLTIPHLFVSPPQPTSLYSPPEVDHSKILSPGEVERMRYYEEKSRHDVIPFDVCSMLAAELREERGRGGRLFAKRRDKADQSSTPESYGLIRVPSHRPEQQKPRFVPEVVAPLPVPVTRAARPREGDGDQPSGAVQVNRLKSMVDLPKPRMTPWDSAVQYGHVEPAFEHLKGYRPYSEQPTQTAALPSSVLPDHGGGSQEMFREGQGQGRDSSHSYYGFKREEVVEDRRTANNQSTYSEPKTANAGVRGFDGSPGFIRQATAQVKGHRPVHFDLGSRSFN